MTDHRDAALAFDVIADDVESLLILLGQATPGAELAIARDGIAALLAGAGLRWEDLAARVTEPLSVPMTPISEIKVDAAAVLTNQELRSFGYRQRGPGYGYEGTEIPGADAPQPTEE